MALNLSPPPVADWDGLHGIGRPRAYRMSLANAGCATTPSMPGAWDMKDTDRCKLLFGPYHTPRFRIGRTVRCEVLGEVMVCGMADARIAWPLCKVGKWKVPVVYKRLARAVRQESEQAVAHWWDVGLWAV
jgi:hypothetical protein